MQAEVSLLLERSQIKGGLILSWPGQSEPVGLSPALWGTRVLDGVLPRHLLRPGNAGAGGLSTSGSLYRKLRQSSRWQLQDVLF